MTNDKHLQNINFFDRNSVEEFLETKKFRPCANLECSRVQLPTPHGVAYMPVCLEGRFKRTGVAEFIEMPLPPSPLSPVTYTTIPVWAPLVSCPSHCRGYRNRTQARIYKAVKQAARWFIHGHDPDESRTVHAKKWWERPLGIVLLGIVVTVVGGLIQSGINHYYDEPTPSPSLPTSMNPPSPSVPIVKAPKPNPQPPSVKIDQHGNSNGAVGGNITTAPCSSVQVGGNNNQATVNCGPSPLEIKWATHDVVPPAMTEDKKQFRFEKQIMVTVNQTYTPISLGFVCNAEIEAVNVGMEGAYMLSLSRMGTDRDNKKLGFVYFEGTPATPAKPLFISVWSNQPFAVLSVAKAKINH